MFSLESAGAKLDILEAALDQLFLPSSLVPTVREAYSLLSFAHVCCVVWQGDKAYDTV